MYDLGSKIRNKRRLFGLFIPYFGAHLIHNYLIELKKKGGVIYIYIFLFQTHKKMFKKIDVIELEIPVPIGTFYRLAIHCIGIFESVEP